MSKLLCVFCLYFVRILLIMYSIFRSSSSGHFLFFALPFSISHSTFFFSILTLPFYLSISLLPSLFLAPFFSFLSTFNTASVTLKNTSKPSSFVVFQFNKLAGSKGYLDLADFENWSFVQVSKMLFSPL